MEVAPSGEKKAPSLNNIPGRNLVSSHSLELGTHMLTSKSACISSILRMAYAVRLYKKP